MVSMSTKGPSTSPKHITIDLTSQAKKSLMMNFGVSGFYNNFTDCCKQLKEEEKLAQSIST